MDKEYEIAKYFAKNGLSIGSRKGIVKYKSDFIYDEDPSHPESHKRGDVQVLNLYVINKEDKEIFELHSYEEYLSWLAVDKSLYVQFNILKDKNNDNYWNFTFYNTKTAEELKTVYSHCKTYDEVAEKAVLYIVKNKILEKYNF